MVIEETRVVYRSTLRQRSFFSRAGAIRAEAIALIKRKWPTEKPEYMEENGYCSYPGFYWQQDIKRSDVLLRRLMRLIAAKHEAA